MNERILIGIPCYNCDQVLSSLITEMLNFKKINDYDFLFIDDGSFDKTLDILSAHNTNYIQNIKNFGYGYSVKKIIKYSINHNYDYCLIFPGDFQRSFQDINRLINAIVENKLDTVSGSKFHIYYGKKGPVGRRVGNKIFTYIARFGWNSNINDVLSGFKIYKIDSIKKFYNLLPDRYSFDIIFSFFASKYHLRQSEISVDCKYNEHTSKIRSVIITAILMMIDVVYYNLKYRN